MAALAPPLRLLVTLNPKKLKKAMLTMLPTVDACQTLDFDSLYETNLCVELHAKAGRVLRMLLCFEHVKQEHHSLRLCKRARTCQSLQCTL